MSFLIFKDHQKIKEYFLVSLALVILILVLFSELFLNFTSAIAGDGGDGVAFLWNFWWVEKSILELHQSPFVSDFMFFPNNMDLRLHTLLLAPAIMMLPVQSLFGSIVSLNIYFLLSFFLAGLGSYLLLKIYTQSPLASFCGSIIYSFNTYVISHAYGHFNLITTWPIPFTIYFLEKSYLTGRKRYSFLASLFYLFLLYSDLQYAIFTALFVFFWFVWKFSFIPKTKQNLFSLFKKGLLFLVTVFFGIFPLLSLVHSGMAGGFVAQTTKSAEFYSPDLLSYVIPPQGTVTNTALASYNFELSRVSFSGPEWATYLGLSIIIFLPLAILKIVREKRIENIFWIIIFFLFLVLSMGPELHFFANQDTGIFLPFYYLHKLPLFSMTRVPVRIMIIAILALSVLIAYLISSIKNLKFRYCLALLFIFLYMGEILLLPIPIQKLECPKAYAFLKEQEIINNNNNVSVIEFPLFFTDRVDLLGRKETIFLFYQTEHEYKMINGYLSYTDPGFLGKYLDIPGMLFLIEPANYEKPNSEKITALENFLYNEAHVKYAILHENKMSRTDFKLISDFLSSELNAKKIYDSKEEDIIIFQFKEN